MKYKKNSIIDAFLRSLAIHLGFIKGKNLVTVFSRSMMVNLDVQGISKAIFCENYREIDHTNIYSKKLFDKQKILDLGANIGYYALQASTDSNKNSKIVCIEPDPRNLELLKENIINNDLSKRVEILAAAVNGEDGKVSFKICSASNLNRIIDKEEKNESSIQVDSISLNTIQKKFGAFDCLRMDVEGAESIILSKNSENFLDSMPVGSIIFLEIHPGLYIGGSSAMNDSMDVLRKYGFTSYEIVSSGKKPDKRLTETLNTSEDAIFKDGKFNRFYYKNISFENAKYFSTLNPKVIRYLIAEKKWK
jgi:FkbM family methyltransferase